MDTKSTAKKAKFSSVGDEKDKNLLAKWLLCIRQIGKNLQWSWEVRLRHSLTINLTRAHSLHLAPDCQDLPGLLAHSLHLAPDCQDLPGLLAHLVWLSSHRSCCSRDTSWLPGSGGHWGLHANVPQECYHQSSLAQRQHPPAQRQQLERSKTVIIYRWHDTKKKTLKTLPKTTRINEFSKVTG